MCTFVELEKYLNPLAAEKYLKNCLITRAHLNMKEQLLIALFVTH